MGSAIALIVRALIAGAVTAIPLTALQEYLDGTFGKLIAAIRDEEGLTWQESKDIVGNIVGDFLFNTVIGAVMMRSKVAIGIAEWFGFTSRGYVAAKLTPRAAVVSKNILVLGSTYIAKKAIPKILVFLGGLVSLGWMISMLAAIVEPGIYKPEQTNALYRKLGIPFQYPTPEYKLQPGPFDPKEFNEYANSIERAGVKGINNPAAQQSQIYSRQNLADVIEYVYGQEALQGNALSKKEVLESIGQYLIGGDAKAVRKTAKGGSSAAPTTRQPIKVFTGLISQGKLGDGTVFTPREDDLIDSSEDLRTAAQNNLASFLVALPGKVVYEIKVVSQITDANGFKRRGEARQIISGYNKNGTPKYKTVINKFAVLEVYIFTARNVRTKIQSIVLGPTDAVAFQPRPEELQGLEGSLRSELITHDVGEIAPTGTTEGVPTPLIIAEPRRVVTQESPATWDNFNTIRSVTFGVPFNAEPGDDGKLIDLKANYVRRKINSTNKLTEEEETTIFARNTNILNALSDLIATIQRKEMLGKAFDIPAPPAGVRVLAAPREARTLSEFYNMQNKPLPSIAERGSLYESYGLGQGAWYTGTAEQNMKLLAELQSRSV